MSESTTPDVAESRLDQGSFIAVRLRTLPSLTLLLSLIGLGIAIYLTFVHYQEEALVCTTGGCETVQQSQYSTIGAIPIAILGVGYFASIAALAASRVLGLKWIDFDTATLISWALTLAASLYYAYLVYLELFVLEAICQWCMLTTIATAIILITESIMVWRWYNAEPMSDVE